MKISEKSTKYVNARLVLIFLIAIMSLSAVQIIRSYSHPGIIAGEESYQISRLASHLLSENKPMFFDKLSYSGRILSLQQGTPILLALFSKVLSIPIETSCIILPITLGIITLILFYLLILKIAVNNKTAQLSLLLLTLSPPFLYTFTTCNNLMFPIPLILLSLLFVANKKPVYTLLSFSFISFFNIFSTLIALSLFLIYSLLKREQRKLLAIIIPLDILIMFLLNLAAIKEYGLPSLLEFGIRGIGSSFASQSFIAEFGGKFGISIFTIILAFSGITSLWKNKFRYAYIYISLLLLIILSMFVASAIIYLNFLLIILAAIGLLNLISIKWESRLIKNFTIFILLAGLIFTFLLHIDKTANLLPDRDIIDSLQALNAESNPEDIVFSHYSNGFWIESVSSRPVFMDANFIYAPDVNTKYNDMQEIFYSRSITTTSLLLEKYKIKYIWITNDMKSGLVWDDEEQGLLFLLKYNTRFKKLFSNQNTELWLVKPE